MIPLLLVNILFINVDIEFVCSIKSTFFQLSCPTILRKRQPGPISNP